MIFDDLGTWVMLLCGSGRILPFLENKPLLTPDILKLSTIELLVFE